MICANCGSSDASDGLACPDCSEDPVLDGRYALLDIIGRGGAGVTYRARRRSDGELVCVKELAYNRMADFDAQKLFEREAAVLRQLDHPGIPAYVDHFTAGEGKALSLYLVQEYVRGHSLEQEMDAYRYTEFEVLGILDDVAEILTYLEDLRPRVVHRDIKPSNILRRDRDNRLMLVDFGSVKATTQSDGQTIVGTAGYMAPEQAWGTATPQSDFYALGVLGVVLLSRKSPHDLLDSSHQLRWERHVDGAPATRELLSRLLQPDINQRPDSARTIRQWLERARDQVRHGYEAPSSEPQTPREASSSIHVTQGARDPASPAGGGDGDPSKQQRVAIVTSAVAAMAVLGVGVGAMLVLQTDDSSTVPQPVVEVATEPQEQREEEPEPPRCPSGECKSFDTPFKAGLSFGMERQDVIDAAREMGEVEEVEARAVTHSRVSGEDEHAVSLPGSRLLLQTRTAGESSTCHLDLSVDERLSSLSCTIEPLNSLSGHRAATKRVVEALIERYGRVTDNNFGTVVEGSVFNENNSWVWSDDSGRIDVVSRFRRVAGDVERSKLWIEQSTPEHSALVEDARERSLQSFEARQKELESEPL